MDLAGSAIKVTRASIGFTQGAGLEMGVNAMSMFAGTTSDAFEEGRVLQLLNMVTAEELIDNDDYEGKAQPAVALSQPVDADNSDRNLRRCHGGMLQVWQDRGHEDPTSFRRQQTVCWRGQDFHQIRRLGVGEEGAAGSGGQKVC